MLDRLRLEGHVTPALYAVAAPSLMLCQYAAVALCYRLNGQRLVPDAGFWLLPMRRFADLPGLSSREAAVVFVLGFMVAGALAVLSFRRANWSGRGHWLSAFVIFPAIQIGVVLLLAVLPRWKLDTPTGDVEGAKLADVMLGVLVGVAIIVAAVLVSALTLGAYGWGLFVATPFVVGISTGYIANRRQLRTHAETAKYVSIAGALGGGALLMLALERLICILLIAPLALIASLIGGAFGRAIAKYGHHRDGPLLSIAVLPLFFALEASMPPSAAIKTSEHIEIAAAPDQVWQTITSDRKISLPPGLPALAGLSYPVRSKLLGEGIGAERLGMFSTGTARERVTEWYPGRRLAFTVLSQPPAMEEMSPYRQVHAPHLVGYVVTGTTRHVLTALPDGQTRLQLEATNVLRVDPIPYFEPIARWAFRSNVRRVLASVKLQAEHRQPAAIRARDSDADRR